MTSWRDHLDELLFEGETVECATEAGQGAIYVTSHRVVTFSPGGPGPRYRAIDRPNVLAVERRPVPRFEILSPAVKLGVAGLVLVAVGLTLDMESLVPRPDVSSVEGVGGVLRTVDTMLALLQQLDDALALLGAACLLAGLALGAIYLYGRESRLLVVSADEEPDVELPDDLAETELQQIRSAIAPPGASEP